MASNKNIPSKKIEELKILIQNPQEQNVEIENNKLVQQIPARVAYKAEGKDTEELIIDPSILDKMSQKDLQHNIKELLELNSKALQSKTAENIADSEKLILKGLLDEITDIKNFFLENSSKKINSKKQRSTKSLFQK